MATFNKELLLSVALICHPHTQRATCYVSLSSESDPLLGQTAKLFDNYHSGSILHIDKKYSTTSSFGVILSSCHRHNVVAEIHLPFKTPNLDVLSVPQLVSTSHFFLAATTLQLRIAHPPNHHIGTQPPCSSALQQEEEDIEQSCVVWIECRRCKNPITQRIANPKAFQLPSSWWTDSSEALVCDESPLPPPPPLIGGPFPHHSGWIFIDHESIVVNADDLTAFDVQLPDSLMCSQCKTVIGTLSNEISILKNRSEIKFDKDKRLLQEGGAVTLWKFRISCYVGKKSSHPVNLFLNYSFEILFAKELKKMTTECNRRHLILHSTTQQTHYHLDRYYLLHILIIDIPVWLQSVDLGKQQQHDTTLESTFKVYLPDSPSKGIQFAFTEVHVSKKAGNIIESFPQYTAVNMSNPFFSEMITLLTSKGFPFPEFNALWTMDNNIVDPENIQISNDWRMCVLKTH